LTVLTTKIRPSKPLVREEYTTSFMHSFDTTKVPRVVLQFLWEGTRLGRNGANVPHEPDTAAPPGTVGPGRCGRPCPCHVLSPEHFLPHVHNLDERDLSRKYQFDRMDEVVITWINGSTSPTDQPAQPSFQEHSERHQAKVVHPTA
jgi:hypothetical protein